MSIERIINELEDHKFKLQKQQNALNVKLDDLWHRAERRGRRFTAKEAERVRELGKEVHSVEDAIDAVDVAIANLETIGY